MAKNDFRIYDVGGLSCAPVFPANSWQVAAATPPTIEAGEPTKASGTSEEDVILLVDADLTIGTDQTFTGVAAADSAETSGAAGFVDLYIPLPGIIYEIRALTTTLVDVRSEISALVGEYHVIDLTSDLFTLDTAAGDGANNAFLIVGGNPTTSTLYVMVRSDATVFGRARV